MHRQTRGDDGKAACHCFDQRMSEGLRVGGRNVNAAGTIDVVQKMVRHRAKFNNLIPHAQLPDEMGCRAGTIGARIRSRA